MGKVGKGDFVVDSVVPALFVVFLKGTSNFIL